MDGDVDCDLLRGINQSQVEKATNSGGQEGEGGREKLAEKKYFLAHNVYRNSSQWLENAIA